ncbi:bifunctional tetrahydrofolate synthase/dihydrofolate synthase [Uliginosibacterium gangwonense]|uniref:bifunctional tetrahydrofolate synthase/dihydrofolate synthase n=1 Tax=Uliginosibacterium gangwonense TaxID=392736 RepID=UPI0003722183|nr:bifunctional tetrahydrofolate synthase/dihydrofolate synthase [Uliginosibacterium gangwonense]
MPVAFATLAEWLAYIEGQHTRSIDLSLERVSKVYHALAAQTSAVVITVGGTNGKGSTCAMLEAILTAAGYRTGLYTSPHLLHYNERVRLNRSDASDEDLCAGFAAVERARGNVPLTYFEYGTLAAWWLFCQHNLDAIILEVGLGGRLDAVNLFDSDCAIVTGVAMDHMDYLGDTREAIGFEKAGIYRAGKPALCGDPHPPVTLLEHAQKIGARLLVQGRDYGFKGDKQQWNFIGQAQRRNSLAYPALRGANQLMNASTVLMALETLEEHLPVPMQAVRQGLMAVELPGRFQVLPGRPSVVLDVAHNPQAAGVLAENLASMGFYPETWAVCGMLSDKDIAGSLAHLSARVDHWLLCDLPGPRGAKAEYLAQTLLSLAAKGTVECFSSPAQAFGEARKRAGEGDRIVTFGSFLTVADVMNAASAAR